MIDDRTAPWSALLLRVVMGALFLFHSGYKFFVFGVAGTGGFFAKIGLPAQLALPIILLEALGGLALILGVATRWVSLVLIGVLLGAIVTVHGANGFAFNAPGGGWEYPAFWIVALLAQAGLGDGALALRPVRRVPAMA